jgi:ADP-ribosylglycohydrolase
MISAIAGDIIGSCHERAGRKTTQFPLFTRQSCFTDDTVLTVAVADCLLGGPPFAFDRALRAYGRAHPNAGYGGMFFRWMLSEKMGPYQSFGNGSAMRVSPVGFAAGSEDEALDLAARSAEPTHDHPEGIKGAQAIALAVLLARKGRDKAQIRAEIERRFGYDLRRTLDAIRPGYQFDVTCQGSVPEAMLAFLESTDVESAIRLAVSLGGDADTQACMAGGIAQAYYRQVPAQIVGEVKGRLTPDLWRVVEAFEARFQVTYEVI